MDFGFSDEQEQLRASVRDFLAAEAPASFARAMMDSDLGMTDASWQAIAGLGWLGLTVPEQHGGSGLGILELAIVMEEMGEVVYPGPFMATVCLGVPAMLAVADEAQQGAVLPQVAAGSHRLTAAVAETRGSWHVDGLDGRATATADGYELNATKLFVPDARSADSLIVVIRLEDALGFFRVGADAPGVTVTPMQTVDRTRKLDVVELAGVRVEAGDLLGGRPVAPTTLDDLADVAKTAAAAELCGIADAALTMTVEYVKIREQFGRAIATFQAIQHKLADMKVLLENARSLTYYAAWALDTGADDRRLAAAMAKAYASDACTRVATEAIQAHGGIGFTWEHDLHLYLKRAKAAEVTYGDATENRELVAQLLEL